MITLSTRPSSGTFALAVALSFILRAAVFYLFVAPGHYYKQPDSPDYHNGALCIGLGAGMHRFNNGQPIFWRTPGYPLYLSWFYKAAGITHSGFEQNEPAQRMSIWIQILISAFIPLIIFALAYLMTHLYWVANLAMWISVFHIGLVLATAFLLTEGISLIFFYLFLFFLYKLILQQPKHLILTALAAAATLSIYTWIRPMGECTGLFAACIIFIAGKGSWKITAKKSLLFVIPFLLTLAPWYIRNHNLTDEWFFAPTSGPYLNCFSAPKIIRRLTGMHIDDACKQAQRAAALEVGKQRLIKQPKGKHVSPLACRAVAVPLIMKYPFYFAYDWMVQVIKTTFDLYSYQLVAIATNAYYWDPTEEFLTEKCAGALWAADIPLASRIIAWLELFFTFALWFALFGGLWHFMLKPWWATKTPELIQRKHRLWWITFWIIAAPIGMTGGFGYARLRLPVEPLMIILALHFWHWFLTQKKVL